MSEKLERLRGREGSERILMLSLRCLFFLRIKGGKGANGLSPIATFSPRNFVFSSCAFWLIKRDTFSSSEQKKATFQNVILSLADFLDFILSNSGL